MDHDSIVLADEEQQAVAEIELGLHHRTVWNLGPSRSPPPSADIELGRSWCRVRRWLGLGQMTPPRRATEIWTWSTDSFEDAHRCRRAE